MSYIKNTSELLSHGSLDLRAPLLRIAEDALERSNPYAAVKSLVAFDGQTLSVGGQQIDLSSAGTKVYFLGAGKASFPIARALEDVLGDRIDDGVLICKYEQGGELRRIRLRWAAHPVPDQRGAEAAKEVAHLAKSARAGDIVICGFTGGSSALMPMPIDGVSLADKQALNRALLHSGADIVEMNAVRKHVSKIKGGLLARMVHPAAQLINLTVSDVIGDRLDYITDPTVPDTSCLETAREALTRYRLWEHVPQSVQAALAKGGTARETPNHLEGRSLSSFVVVGSATACEAAAASARGLGYDPMILSSVLEGESREAGRLFASIAKEVSAHGRPLRAPCAVIAGGETTVTIDGDPGIGGPNQEFALASALYLEEGQDVAVLGLDTDGTDGPTRFAGGIGDQLTNRRAIKDGIDLFDALQRHDVTPTLERLGDAVETGATGTNVNDLKVMLIKGAPEGE